MARFLNGLQFLARPMRLWMLFQSHIGRVSMSTLTLKAVKHGPHSPEKAGCRRLWQSHSFSALQSRAGRALKREWRYLLGDRFQPIDHQASILMMSRSHPESEISFGVNGKLIDIECTFLVGPPRPRFGRWYLD